MKMLSSSEDDYKLLIVKKFVLVFEDGVCVVKHWRLNNFIRKDLYKSTKYIEHKKSLFVKPNGAYTFDEVGAERVPEGYFVLDKLFESKLLLANKNNSMERKNSFKYKGENHHPEFETEIDMDSGDEIIDTKEKDANEKVTKLLEWGAKVRGKKFFDPVTQRSFLNQMRTKGITPRQIMDAYIELLHSDYWKRQDRLPDFKTVYSNMKNKK